MKTDYKPIKPMKEIPDLRNSNPQQQCQERLV